MSLAKLEQLSEIPNLSKELKLKEKLKKECERYEIAKEYFSCDFQTGIIIWAKKTGYASHVKVGSIAGFKCEKGYIIIKFQDKRLPAHRFIFYLVNGYLTEQIDHKNRIRDDNRPVNLRGANHQKNCQNISIAKNNTSGVQGVFLHKRDLKWYAYISINDKRKFLGSFAIKEDAIEVRKAAELLYYPFKYQGN